MEIKIVIDDTLLSRCRQFFRRIGLVFMALLAAVPMLLLARSAMNEYGLTVFNPGSVISSDAVNANFDLLAKQSDALQSSVDSLEAAITVDGNNNVGIGSTSPSANLDVKGNLSKVLSGIVSTAKGSAVVTGSDTKFMDELKVGDAIRIGAEVFTVAVIKEQDSLTLDAPPTTSLGGTLAYTDSDLLSIQNGDGTGKVVVDKSGNVGVGTRSPIAQLHIHGGRIRISESDGAGASGVLELAHGPNSSDTSVIFTSAAGDLNLYPISPTHHVLLQPTGGKVGIGTTAPQSLLHVNGAIRIGSAIEVLEKQGNDGTVSCSTYCGGTSWAGWAGVCLAGFRNTKAPVGCGDVDPGKGLQCLCARLP